MKRQLILEIICALLILLFLYTSISKWMDLNRFVGDMNNQPFPHWIAAILVWAVPTVETLISLALIFNKTRQSGLWLSFIVMSLFTLYAVAILLHLFNRVPCGCGGIIRGLTWPEHLFSNLFFVLISLSGALIDRKSVREANQLKSRLQLLHHKIFHAWEQEKPKTCRKE